MLRMESTVNWSSFLDKEDLCVSMMAFRAELIKEQWGRSSPALKSAMVYRGASVPFSHIKKWGRLSQLCSSCRALKSFGYQPSVSRYLQPSVKSPQSGWAAKAHNDCVCVCVCVCVSAVFSTWRIKHENERVGRDYFEETYWQYLSQGCSSQFSWL